MKKNKTTHFGFEKVSSADKGDLVKGVFDSVAESYDLMNDLMSLGLHRLWKKALLELAELPSNPMILDIASGTADIPKLLIQTHRNASVQVTDINSSMLKLGRNRAIDENFISNCFFLTASGEELPYKNETFDLITIGFGLRNFTDKKKGLQEMYRCLKPTGSLLVLEFSKPKNAMLEKIYDWYSFKVLPKMGKFFADDEKSYQYLAESIRMHPDQEKLKNIILDQGFSKCSFYNFQNGIVSIHKAIK
ncbi:MAG: bifunctional demethylmenaquinone methyltransferase/2-methoxy-6-polyprenyl-1,4-benzoquinol methylase UbiE [Gammaproteobacteria bacterium]